MKPRIDPTDLAEYNIPFAGDTQNKLARARLRFLKMELMENPRVNKAYIRGGVREFLPALEKVIATIPKGSSLIVMPSTTGQNRIPAMLGDGIVKLRPDIELVNAKGRSITVQHLTESKFKEGVVDRLRDHRNFAIKPELIAKRGQLNRSSFILDDSISTGDSAITLHRQLLREGIYARGIIAAVSGSRYHVRQSDVDRLYEKIKDHRPADYRGDQLKLDMYNTFIGYPEAKVKRLELGLTRDRSNQIYQRPDLVVQVIRTTSAYLNKEKLGAGHMLEMRKQVMPELGNRQTKKPQSDNKLKF